MVPLAALGANCRTPSDQQQQRQQPAAALQPHPPMMRRSSWLSLSRKLAWLTGGGRPPAAAGLALPDPATLPEPGREGAAEGRRERRAAAWSASASARRFSSSSASATDEIKSLSSSSSAPMSFFRL